MIYAKKFKKLHQNVALTTINKFCFTLKQSILNIHDDYTDVVSITYKI